MERRPCQRPCRAVVADDPLRRRGRHAMAGCLLSRLQDKPSDRHPKAGPASARVGGKPCAEPAVLLVPWFGTDAGDNGVARVPAGRKPRPRSLSAMSGAAEPEGRRRYLRSALFKTNAKRTPALLNCKATS